MIFVTVGAQMAFDRLVMAVDAWAGAGTRGEIFAQIGPSEAEPKNIEWTRFMDPPEFRAMCDRASIIVAHAGMGSIITALELGKPLLIMPRHGDLRETRNDHQIATARRFSELQKVSVAWDETEVGPRLDELLAGAASAMHAAGGSARLGAYASPQLISALRSFIDGTLAPPNAGTRAGVRAPAFRDGARDAVGVQA